ncbi:MAG: DsbA family protein [Pseudomonadota bacterium]
MTNEEKFAAIWDEAEVWQQLSTMQAETELRVYLDLKSPHAYLAVRPSLAVARDYRVRVNVLPYTLSYEVHGLTTEVGADMQRKPPSAAADRKARMYYTAAREYAALQRLPFRTPVRLLDSELAHRYMMFAKAQQREIAFIMQVYMRGWGSGWRDFTLEADEDLQAALRAAGCHLDGAEDFVTPHGEGAQQVARCLDEADASGYAGVPHYMLTDPASGRLLGIFGREHLTLIRQKFAAAGLARSAAVVPEFSHAWSGRLTL